MAGAGVRVGQCWGCGLWGRAVSLKKDSEWRWCDEAAAFPDPIPLGRGGPTMCSRYLQAMGWSAPHTSVARYIKQGKLPPSCPEGWSQAHLNKFAWEYFLPRDETPAKRFNPSEVKQPKAKRTGLDYETQLNSLAEAFKQAKADGQLLENELKKHKLALARGEFVSADVLHEKQLAMSVVFYDRVREELSACVSAVIRAAGGDVGNKVAVSQAIQDALDKGMRSATKREAFRVAFDQCKDLN